MSLAKAVPNGINDKECKRFTLQECHPFPYLPEKDPIKEMFSALKSDQSLKTTIREDAELSLPIWHCGTCKSFLFMGVQLSTRSRNGAPSRPTRKPVRLM
jgi:hypothetical protein